MLERVRVHSTARLIRKVVVELRLTGLESSTILMESEFQLLSNSRASTVTEVNRSYA